MLCTKCGEQLADSAISCPNCGTPCGIAASLAQGDSAAAPQSISSQDMDWQQLQHTVAESRPASRRDAELQESDFEELVDAQKSSGKGLKLGLGVLMLAAIVAASVWLLSNLSKPEKKLAQAADRSVALLKDYLGELPNLNTIVKNLEAIDPNGVVAYGLEAGQAQVYGSGEGAFSTDKTVKADFTVDGKNQRFLISADLGNYLSMDNQQLPLTFYMDSQEIRFASSALLDQDEALAIPSQDLAKKFNESALAKMTGQTLPAELDSYLNNAFKNKGSTNLKDMLNDAELKRALTETYGEDWSKFEASCEVVKYEGVSPFGSEGDTYSLKWDRESLKAMLKKTDLSEFSTMQMDEIMEMDPQKMRAIMLVFGFGSIDENLADFPCFCVKDGAITGICVDLKEGNRRIVLSLQGEKNPWEKILFSAQSKTDNGYKQEGSVELRLSNADGQLRVSASASAEESKQAETAALIYNDSDGKLSVEINGQTLDTLPEISLFPKDGDVCLNIGIEENDSFGLSSSTNDDADPFAVTNRTIVKLYMGSRSTAIEAPGSKKIELLNLSEEELNALVERVQKKLNELPIEDMLAGAMNGGLQSGYTDYDGGVFATTTAPDDDADVPTMTNPDDKD